MKKLKFHNVILCEFAAKGDRNKHTLVNVFSGDIVIQSLPSPFNFGLYLEFEPDRLDHPDLVFSIRLGGKERFKFGAAVTVTGLPGKVVMAVPMVGTEILNDDLIEVIAKCEGYRNTVVLSRKIFKGDVPQA